MVEDRKIIKIDFVPIYNFCGLLTALFITAKLCGFFEYGWMMVLSPLWIPILLIMTGLVFVPLKILLICTIISMIKNR